MNTVAAKIRAESTEEKFQLRALGAELRDLWVEKNAVVRLIMRRLRKLFFRLQPFFRRRKIETGLSEEIQSHLEMAAYGFSPSA